MKEHSTKDHVLRALEQNKGNCVTGAELASELGVSRNAVWKAVNELKEAGYDIVSAPRRGYSLNAGSDIISVGAIEACMRELAREAKNGKAPAAAGAAQNCAANGHPALSDAEISAIADTMLVYDELKSTNETAKMSLVSGMLDKQIIIARRQTSGIGHDNTRFESPEGGIYMSVILRPAELDEMRLRARGIGETVRRVIRELSGREAVLDEKNNRVLIDGDTAAGILTEYFADLETGYVNGYVVGIGVRLPGIPKNRAIAMLLTGLSSVVGY